MARGAVAVWQTAPAIRQPQVNLARLETAAQEARAHGATILVTPELALTGYDIGVLDPASTDPALVGEVADIARRQGIALVAGLTIRESAQAGPWNVSVIVDRLGQVRALYRKVHLFGDIDRSRFLAGAACSPAADLDGIVVATLICYDIEFPEPARIAALAGAHLLAVPTANMVPWTFINEHIIPVRAFENQLYVAYANHVGSEGDTAYLGRSVIAAPDGTTARAGAESEEIVVMPIDTDELDQRRRVATYLADRRPDLYQALAKE